MSLLKNVEITVLEWIISRWQCEDEGTKVTGQKANCDTAARSRTNAIPPKRFHARAAYFACNPSI